MRRCPVVVPPSSALSAGDIYGELSLLGGHPVAANPEIHHWLSVLLAQGVRELSNRVRDLMFVGLDRRLYACVLELADSTTSTARRARSCR